MFGVGAMLDGCGEPVGKVAVLNGLCGDACRIGSYDGASSYEGVVELVYPLSLAYWRSSLIGMG